MSGAHRVRSMTMAEPEVRPVFGPARNKAQRSVGSRKPMSKCLRKVDKSLNEDGLAEEKDDLPSSTIAATSSPPLCTSSILSILRRQESLPHSNLSLCASYSSDASSDSSHSRASTGRIYRSRCTMSRRRLGASKPKGLPSDVVLESLPDSQQAKRRCAWVTANADLSYATFHDEEWGVPVHDDRKLFELLILSGALAELTWPAILSKRHIFREVFMEFDSVAVSKLNERKIVGPESTASSLLSELKLHAVIENARQISKVTDEFGSFDEYIWSFVNHKPIISQFRYPRQVPVRTPKADVISKDLVRRGFRGVGPTVVYSFMQVAGITNDHLISCFRFHECAAIAQRKEKEAIDGEPDEEKVDEKMEAQLRRAVDELVFSTQ